MKTSSRMCSVSGFRSASASASPDRLLTVNTLTSEYYTNPSVCLLLRILTVKQVTALPAAFNLNSPQDCGSCRQQLLSASWMVYCYTHGKTLFAAEPEADGERWKKKAEQTEPFQEGAFQVMPVDEKLKRHKKGALRGKKREKNKTSN